MTVFVPCYTDMEKPGNYSFIFFSLEIKNNIYSEKKQIHRKGKDMGCGNCYSWVSALLANRKQVDGAMVYFIKTIGKIWLPFSISQEEVKHTVYLQTKLLQRQRKKDQDINNQTEQV